MGKYFSINELSYSSTASREGIDNTPPAFAITAMTHLVNNLLDPIRKKWGGPISVNSGYRSPLLNQAVGGVPNSQHVKGEAADITAGSKGENRELFELIRTMHGQGLIEIDQLIDEDDYSWLHVSLRQSGNRGEIFKL